ncbi:L,D-transpeptidase family protein [Sandarakinorhabdus oryzae]|uniref:L,D-transpeptidase family protein n=1 Tax=Sandarakinorhabdus oryzae TaxID=2675220 RepID=UPI001EFF8453|nr:L,D-transpeptidase family protein [Sandarakinorhabdus oryzae]
MRLTGISQPSRLQLRTWVSVIGLVAIGICAVITTPARQRAAAPLVLAKPAPASEGPRVYYSRISAPTLTLADGRNRRVLSMLNIRHKLNFGDFVWDDRGIADGETWIMVDLKGQTMSVFRGGHEIGATAVLYGADSKPTPAGVFPVLEKARTHRSTLYDAEMPFMLRLSWDGVAIHASNVQVGQATHGCIGVPPAFAKRLYNQVQLGDLVSVAKA